MGCPTKIFALIEDMTVKPPSDPIIEWADNPDLFSDQCRYEDFGRSQSRGSLDMFPGEADLARDAHTKHPTGSPIYDTPSKGYVKLDPLREASPSGEEGPKLVASFDLRVAYEGLKRNGFALLMAIVGVLVFEHEFMQRCEVKGTEPDRRPRKERMHPKNLSELMEWDFMAPLAPPGMKGSELDAYMSRYHAMRFSSLFTVPKSSGTPPPHRLVVNGIPGNEVLQRPPYFTFFSPACIVARLRALWRFTGFTVDIRHCFYRIPMHPRMGRYYAIAPGGKYYVPTVVPMGATWGPALGQATTIAMISLRRSANEPTLGLRVPQDTCPSVLDIVVRGVVVGHIFVCIDNICVVAQDPALVAKWWTRIERNAKMCGIWPFKREQTTNWTQSAFEFIGIAYSDGQWHHCKDRIAKWANRYGVPLSDVEKAKPVEERAAPALRDLTPDELQSFVGVLVWDKRLRVTSTRALREVFAIMTRAVRKIAPVMPSLVEKETLSALWFEFLRNPKQTWEEVIWPPPCSEGRTAYIATDASDTAWSWTELVAGRVVRKAHGPFLDLATDSSDTAGSWTERVAGKVVRKAHGPFPDQTTAIYYKEMYAVLLALRALVGSDVRNIVLVGDNTAVIGSIRKRMAPEGAWAMLDEIENLIVSNGWGLVLKWVESDGNVAHSATHDESITEYREARTWRVMTEELYSEPIGGRGKRDIDGVPI